VVIDDEFVCLTGRIVTIQNFYILLTVYLNMFILILKNLMH